MLPKSLRDRSVLWNYRSENPDCVPTSARRVHKSVNQKTNKLGQVSMKRPIAMKTMFELPWELERPSVPAAKPPAPTCKTIHAAEPTDQPKKKRKARKKAMSFLSEEEIERLFGVIASIRDRAIFRLAYHAGLRASEIGMLQLRDYDAKAAKIFVHRLKGSNSGHHHLMREEARALRAWLKVRGSYPGPILLSKQKRPIDRTTLHLLMKKYGAAAGIPEKLRHFHVLKHCCATHLLSKGFGVDRKSTRLNSSHQIISYAVFCLKKKKNNNPAAHPII